MQVVKWVKGRHTWKEIRTIFLNSKEELYDTQTTKKTTGKNT